VLRSAWRFSDGATAEGQSVTHRFAAARASATVTVMDAAGGQASASALCVAARRANRPRHHRTALRRHRARHHRARPHFTG
jgi:phage baseplate assembly protein gpV